MIATSQGALHFGVKQMLLKLKLDGMADVSVES